MKNDDMQSSQEFIVKRDFLKNILDISDWLNTIWLSSGQHTIS